MKTMEGRNLVLRPINDSDTSNIISWRNKEFVRRNFIYQEMFTKESHENWIRTMVKTKKVIQFIMAERESGRDIGSVYLRDIDYKNAKAEYGIFIGEEDALGRGFGTEAAKLILTYAFEELYLHKIMLRVFAHNTRAVQSYLKAGFVQEGYFKDEVKINSEYYDIIFMAKINEKDDAENEEENIIYNSLLPLR